MQPDPRTHIVRYCSLILCSLACWIMAPSVLGQTTGSSFEPVGIRWNGFSATDPDRVALEPIDRNTSAVHDLPSIPSPYSYHALGFFCKAEVKLNRFLPFPVMVRLGDVQRAEELDGKGPNDRSTTR